MIDKKILLSGAGALALSVAIAVTINVYVTGDAVQPTSTPGQLSCSELQRAIDNLGTENVMALPQLVVDNITWLQMQGIDCELQGKGWTIGNGEVKIENTTESTIVGDEKHTLSEW